MPTSALRKSATLVKVLNGTVYTIFLAPRVLVASHVMLLSIPSSYYYMPYQAPLSYAPISSSATRPLGVANFHILLSEGERAYKTYAPPIWNFRELIF